MKPLVNYLIPMIACSAILYTYFHFALRNKKFHQYNRFYLLAVSVISLVIPALNIPFYYTSEQANSPVFLQILSEWPAAQNINSSVQGPDDNGLTSQISLTTWIWILYLFVVFALLTRLMISILKIRRLTKKYKPERFEGFNFFITTEPGTPFSFFRWLFWNKRIDLDSKQGQQVFQHELYHIKEKHSFDILWMEALTAVFWFNPFFHLAKKEIKAIQEFLADRFAVKENNRWEYLELLLMEALKTKQKLVNPFFHNQIKRRIAMITTSHPKGLQYLRRLMIIPFAIALVFLFAFSYRTRTARLQPPTNGSADTLPDMKKKSAFYSAPDKIILESDTLILFPEASMAKIDLKSALIVVNGEKKDFNFLKSHTIISDEIRMYSPGFGTEISIGYNRKADQSMVVLINARIINIPVEEYYSDVFKKDIKVDAISNNIIFEKVEIEPSFPGGDVEWKFYIARNLNFKLPALTKAPKGNYTVVLKFVVDKEGRASNFKALTNHGFGMEEEAFRVVKNVPQWHPAIQNGHTVTAYKKVKITFSVFKELNQSYQEPASLSKTAGVSESGEEETVYYFCMSHSMYPSTVKGKQFIIYTTVSELTGDENKIKEMSRKWGEYVTLNCENQIGCTSDLNYHKSKEQADLQLEKMKMRYSDLEKFILKKVEFN